MSSSDRSENNTKTDDPYERMLISLTGKGSEDRKSKEKAIRFPVKLMYILQCGDYNHLIDWIDEDMDVQQNAKNAGHGILFNTSGKSDKFNHPHNTNDYPKSTAFIIYDTKAFETQVLPAIFKEGKFDSFERKLYRWGFATTTVKSSRTLLVSSSSSSTKIYEHPYFCKGDYATANKIACSGSEVKRYKQIHKDKKNQSRKRKPQRSKRVSSIGSTIRSMDTSPSSAAPPSDMKIAAATNINNVFSSTQTIPPIDNQLYLDQEDRWNALYLSTLRNEKEEENDEGSDTFMDSSRIREDFMPTSMMASNVQYHSHRDRNDEEQRMEERAQSFGVNATTTHDQAMLGETNSSTMTNMLLLQQEQDTILLQHLRKRRNCRQNILEMIQRSHQN